MPELPEVETTRRGLAPHIEGLRIATVIVRDPRLRWPVPDGLAQTLAGVTVTQIGRRGKYLLLYTEAGTLLWHLGMSGSLRILLENVSADKHDHIDLVFSNGTVLRFNDPRRFGALLWTTEPVAGHPLLNKLGPEPLSDAFSGELLHQRARNRKVPVKSFIMDSRTVVGVGNIYANEALFMAGILPTCPAGELELSHYRQLADSIRVVLKHAIQQGGTTLRNFVNEAGRPGYFQQALNVYGRSGLPCTRCGQPLQEIRLAHRTTVYCGRCQRQCR